MDSECLNLEIPPRLHTDGRTPDPDFPVTEEIYRHCPSNKGIENANEILKFDPGLSLNRQKYCESPCDVLFDPEHGKHKQGRNILCFTFEALQGHVFSNAKQPDKPITLRIRHTPHRCMYPHTDIFILLNGEEVQDVERQLGKVTRKAIRDKSSEVIQKRGRVLLNQSSPAR
jgi:hypothetical protein